MQCAKIHFSGGESLLRDDLHALLSFTAGRGIRANMTTNATLIACRDDALQLVDTGLNSVSVSLDAADKKTHDRLRGTEGAFKRTTRGIERLVAACAKRRVKTKVRLNVVITRRNYTRLPEVVRLAGELGCTEVHPMPVDERGPRRVRLSKQQIVEYGEYVVPQLLDLRSRYGFSTAPELVNPLGTSETDIKLARRGKYARRYYKRHLCYAPWLHVFLAWNGDAYLCCMARGKTPPLGNVREQSVAEVFGGSVYEGIRDQFHQSRLKICHRCDNFLVENRLLHDALAAHSQEPADSSVSSS